MSERRLFIFVLAYFLGIIFFKYKSIILLVFILLMFVFLANKIKKPYYLLIFFVLGYLFIFSRETSILKKINSIEAIKYEQCKFIISSDVKKRPKTQSFYLKYKKYLISAVTNDQRNYEYGDVLVVKNPKIIKLKPSANFNLSNYDDYLKLQGVQGRVFINPAEISLYKKPLFSVSRSIYRIKNYLTEIHKRSLPPAYADLLISIIFGDSVVELEDSVANAYRRSGLVHLLVVSGSQIAIIAGLIFSLVKIIKLSNKTSFLIVSAVLTLFTLATGAGASIVRAWLMVEIGLFALLSGRQKDLATSIALAAFIASLFNPNIIFDIGFQLSYAATIALIYLAPIIKNKMANVFSEKTAFLLSTSLAPIILTMPFTIFYFNSISLVALPVNLLLVFWLEILVISGFLVTILGIFVFPLAKLLNIFNYGLLFLINKLVFFVNNFSWAVLSIKQISFFIFIVLIMIIISIAEYLRTKNYKYKLAVYGLLFICLISLLFSKAADLKITMLDVGQGESIIIKTPQNGCILIDCGNEKYDPAKNIIVPALVKQGVKQIDYLILTHQHKDHNSGLQTIIKNMKIKKVIGEIPAGIAINTGNVLCLIPSQNAEYQLNELKLKAVYAAEKSADINDDSTVYLLEYNRFKMLFAGDADHTAENYIIENNKKTDIDVLKVGHHGSKTSTSYKFLKYVKPENALISVGEKNKYRLPNLDTLNRLKDYSRIYRTDLDGAIEITVDKNGNYKIKTFNSSRKPSYF